MTMNTRIIDGRKIANDELNELRLTIQKNKLTPDLLIIQVGDDQASSQYIAIKKKRAAEIGIATHVEKIGATTEAELKSRIQKLIQDYHNVDGIMIQLPLPTTVNTQAILSLIPPQQDVDGLLLEKSPHGTAVAAAVEHILAVEKLQEKNILILGDSPYVGESVRRQLSRNQAELIGREWRMTNRPAYPNVAIANEFSSNILQQLKQADVVISCIGKPKTYNARQLKQGATLIDVGTSPDETGKIVGDFDTSEADGYLAAYTPVPGGVGPITVAMLLRNLVFLVFDQEI
jgi:methylenetetrahydrofolate dehydrogenase (NADP+)/methenyltetrahydrofolate cyclohydrolase